MQQASGLQLARITIVALLIIGVLWVLRPFLSPLLTALIIVVATWTPYQWLTRTLGNRKTLAASLMTLLLTVVILIPMFFLGGQLTKVGGFLIAIIQEKFANGIPNPPDWLVTLPYIGEQVQEYWAHLVNDSGALTDVLQRMYEPARKLVTSITAGVANGALHAVMNSSRSVTGCR